MADGEMDAPPSLFYLCGVVYGVGGSTWFTTIGFLDEAVADDLKEARALRGIVPACFYLGMACGVYARCSLQLFWVVCTITHDRKPRI